jgi:YtkA-like
MNFLNVKSAALAATIGVACIEVVSQAWAGIGDYEFQLVQSEVKKGNDAIVAVRLIDKRSGKAVTDAVIIAKRVDMAPDGMAEMAEPIEQLPSTEPGVYRFKAAVVMAGGWRLSLGAKVQGETGTVENKLEFKAVP